VGEETDPDLLPDAEGDALPGKRMPPGTGLPKRQPSLGAGRMEHPLPDLSEQDAAKMARKLADERANLEEQSASDAPDEHAPSGQQPPAVPHAFPPAQRRAELRLGRLPPFTPAAEEAWAQAYKAASSLMIAAADKDSLNSPSAAWAGWPRYMPHRECEAYVAGPPAMVLETVQALAKSGLPLQRIHYDGRCSPTASGPERGEQSQ
jgi:hypothetical protein